MNITEEPKSYENMRNALSILKIISQGEQEIKDNKIRPQDEVFKNLEKNLKNEQNQSDYKSFRISFGGSENERE